jgi:hypothetical protein
MVAGLIEEVRVCPHREDVIHDVGEKGAAVGLDRTVGMGCTKPLAVVLPSAGAVSWVFVILGLGSLLAPVGWAAGLVRQDVAVSTDL